MCGCSCAGKVRETRFLPALLSRQSDDFFLFFSFFFLYTYRLYLRGRLKASTDGRRLDDLISRSDETCTPKYIKANPFFSRFLTAFDALSLVTRPRHRIAPVAFCFVSSEGRGGMTKVARGQRI